MTAGVDLKSLQRALEEANKVAKIRSKIDQLHDAIDQIVRLRQDLTSLVGGGRGPAKRKAKVKKAARRAGKKAKLPAPKPGSAPEKLCRVMGKTPVPVSEIAKKTGLSENTVRVYLGQYKCFKNVRGKGYTCSHTPSAGGPTVKKAKKVKKATKAKKARKVTKKTGPSTT